MNTLEQLNLIMEFLQKPEQQGPWDPDQDLDAIVPHTIREAYGVADAIRNKDNLKMRSGLGSLLLQVIYLIQSAEHKGLFSLRELLEEIYQNLTVQTSRQVTDRISDADISNVKPLVVEEAPQDKNNPGTIQEKPGLLDDIPVNLPALSRAQRLQAQAAKVGFDWKDIGPIWSKLEEELQEIKSALSQDAPYSEIMGEAGDLIFVCVNLCRHLSIDAESALFQTNNKFCSRFNYIEYRLNQDGKTPEEVPLEVMDSLWEEAKQKVKKDLV